MGANLGKASEGCGFLRKRRRPSRTPGRSAKARAPLRQRSLRAEIKKKPVCPLLACYRHDSIVKAAACSVSENIVKQWRRADVYVPPSARWRRPAHRADIILSLLARVKKEIRSVEEGVGPLEGGLSISIGGKNFCTCIFCCLRASSCLPASRAPWRVSLVASAWAGQGASSRGRAGGRADVEEGNRRLMAWGRLGLLPLHGSTPPARNHLLQLPALHLCGQARSHHQIAFCWLRLAAD